MPSFVYLLIYLAIAIFIILLLKIYFNGPSAKVKDMTGKVVIVTGSSASIGKETAFDLIKQGAIVIFACRNESKTLSVINKLDSKYRDQAIYMNLNLNSFKSVRKFVEEFKKKFNKLDILINNAGTLFEDFIITEDGFEATLQTNTLSPILLTDLLYDTLVFSQGKCINVASDGHKHANYDTKRFDFNYFLKKEIKKEAENYDTTVNNRLNQNENTPNDISKIHNRGDYSWSYATSFQQYCFSKLGNVYFTQFLDDFAFQNKDKIFTYSVHPGFIINGRMNSLDSNSCFVKFLLILLYPILYILSKSQNKGAQTTLHCCYAEDKDLISGGYYKDCKIGSLGKVAKADKKEQRKEYILKCFDLINSSGFSLENQYKVSMNKNK